jgi:hypothetical protein
MATKDFQHWLKLNELEVKEKQIDIGRRHFGVYLTTIERQ